MPFVTKLDEATLKKAREELNEDPTRRDADLQMLRDWLKTQPHLQSRTDDDFLIRYLRRSKFSMLLSQELLDRYWTERSKNPTWFSNMDPQDPEIKELTLTGTNVPLPGCDAQGRSIILFRIGARDPAKHSFDALMKLGFMNTEVMLKDENVQVNGFVGVGDFEGFGMTHVAEWSPGVVSRSMRCWQDAYPVRMKGMHYLRTPKVFDGVFTIVKSFMKEKMKKRLHLHGNDMEALYQHIPKSSLPTEYGGDAGPIATIAEEWWKKLMDNRRELLEFNLYGCDENKRPTKRDLQDNYGVAGAFRKLTVD